MAMMREEKSLMDASRTLLSELSCHSSLELLITAELSAGPGPSDRLLLAVGADDFVDV
jgi:hypothetical protein